MAHIHDVFNTDNRFAIDPNERRITQKSGKNKLMRGDHNSECYAFEIPRYVEGHDMSACDSVRIHYINSTTNKSGESKGPYVVTDIMVNPDDPEMVVFSWTPSRNATKYVGTLDFSIEFRCFDKSVVEYEWNTDIFNGIKISDRVENDGNEIVEENVDILEQWREVLFTSGSNGSGSGTNGQDGFSPIANVARTDNGVIITITDANGTTTATVEDGIDGAQGIQGERGFPGEDGHTPVKGVDYYTDADKADFSEYIASELAKRGQLKPEFANSTAECTDTTKLYVLPDGLIYAYVRREETTEDVKTPNFTNLLTHPDAVITHDKRFSHSSNGYKDLVGCDAVIIPLPESADGNFTIRCRDCGYYRSGSTQYATGYFSADKTTWYYPKGSSMTWTIDANGDEVTTSGPETTTANKYLVMNMNALNESAAIITVNEEITYTTVEGGTTVTYEWASTGHAFVPANYEDRIVASEDAIDDLNRRVDVLEKIEPASPANVIPTMVYAPSPQLPADGSETADFDAENISVSDIYDYIDALAAKYPQYLTKETLGKDASGALDWNRYTASRRTYDAWAKPNYPAMYAWTNGSTVIYSVSVSPRVGDTMYSTEYVGTSYGTVTAVSNANQTRTVNGLVFARDAAKDIAPTLVYTRADYNSRRPGSWNTWHNTVYNSSRGSIGTISSIVNGILTDSDGNSYNRYPMGDKNSSFAKLPVLVIGSNEHGGNSYGDPAEPAIISTRIINDLCECRNADNPFLNMLKSEYMIVFCPVINPWGYGKDNGYVNANGVNIDRNFDTPGWGNDSDTRHGAYGGSENETQYFMNTLMESGAKIALANHALGYKTDATTGELDGAGLCSYMLCRNDAKYTAHLAQIAETMNVNYGLGMYDMGEAPGDSYGKTRSYMDHVGIEGGAVEMTAIDGYLLHGGSRHTAKILEADYTLLLQFLQMLIECRE